MTQRHRRRRSAAVIAGLSAVVLTAIAGCGNATSTSSGSSGSSSSGTTGFTDSEVRVATSLPTSGTSASAGQEALGAKAYFDSVNAQGGVTMKDGKKRKITYKFEDDAYDPSRTVSNVRELVTNFKPAVFFNLYGTENIKAAYDYLSTQQIPMLWVQSGASQWQTTGGKWVIADGMSYAFEMNATVQYIDQKHPAGSKIAVLYQADSYGQDIIDGLKAAVKGTKDTIVAEQTYNVGASSVSSQVAKLAAAKPTVFVNEAIGTPSADAIKSAAQLMPSAEQYIAFGAANQATMAAAGAAANGVYSTLWQKDATNPQWAKDPDVVQLMDIAAKYGGSGAKNSNFWAGMRTGELLVDTLEGAQPSGQSVLDAASNLNNVKVPAMAGDLPVTTRPGYPYLVTKVNMWQFKSNTWAQVGGPYEAPQQ
jgi:branched-chain amino acid transport system substrate-binding protein